MRVPLFVLSALSMANLVGCGDPTPEVNADPTSSTATAVVVVERTSGPGMGDNRGDTVNARFVRVRQGAVDEAALRIAGIAEDVPVAGSCSAPIETSPSIQGRSVELLDVGQVVLSDSAAKSMVLLPRSMPNPAGVVSGVFYSARAADAFSAGSPVTLRSLGGPDLVEGFAVSSLAPREVSDVRVASTAGGLEVSWDPGDADLHDLFYVDVLSPGARVVVRCSGVDPTRVVVPSSAFVGVDDAQLAVHRLHKESFRAKGIEPGEVRFDVAKIVSVR